MVIKNFKLVSSQAERPEVGGGGTTPRISHWAIVTYSLRILNLANFWPAKSRDKKFVRTLNSGRKWANI